jgi:hypothetical protein
MNSHPPLHTSTKLKFAPGCLDEYTETIIAAIPNSLQNTLIETLYAISSLCYELDIVLPAHNELSSYLSYNFPVLPAVVSEDVEKTLLEAIQKTHKTRTMLLKLWLNRMAQQDQMQGDYWPREDILRLG